jgi:hypothetical protein
MFKQLNEALEKLLEGSVVSFADYKRQKRNKEFMDRFGDELEKSTELLKQQYLTVSIDKIKVLFCEAPNGNPHFDMEEYAYENFQKIAYAVDYLNQAKGNLDKCDIEIFLSADDGDKQSFRHTITLGDGKQECDIYSLILNKLSKLEDKKVLIDNDPAPYEERYYKGLVKEYGLDKKEEPEQATYIKDYTKDPQDVQVGDILVRNWGYSMVLVDFYKVIEVIKRKLTHVRLAKLEKRAVKGDLSQGEVIPTQTTVKNYLVDGKRFRVGVRWAKDVVCQVDDHACYYWNGEPQRLDTMD